MDVFAPCPALPDQSKFFTLAGAVERIRQGNLSRSHAPKECSACGGWHVVARGQEAA